MKLSEHFTLEEMTYSETAIRRGIDNTPDETCVNNLKSLCENVLEPLRTKLGKPLKITSGYRCRQLNSFIGGSANSQHQYGCAADIQVKGMTSKELFDFVRANKIKFDQCIEEFGSWVHISFTSNNRKESLIATKDENGKTKYDLVS